MKRKLLPSKKARIVFLASVIPAVAVLGYLALQLLGPLGILKVEPIIFYWDTERGGGSEIEGYMVLVLGYPLSLGQGLLVMVPILLLLAYVWLRIIRALFLRTERSTGIGSAGVPLPPACPQCGREVRADWRNCPYCGKLLTTQT